MPFSFDRLLLAYHVFSQRNQMGLSEMWIDVSNSESIHLNSLIFEIFYGIEKNNSELPIDKMKLCGLWDFDVIPLFGL